MPRPVNPVPSYRHHKPTGQAVVTVPKPGGGRRDIYLGKYGSDESKAESARVLAQLRAAGGVELSAGVVANPPDLTVNELLVRFLAHADGYYRHPDGTPTSEPRNYRHSLRQLRRLYGHTPAAEFGPLALKAVRHRMVDDGWCRSLVNKSVGRVKSVFRWAASEEMVPAAVCQALDTVAGLGKGRSAAREAAPVAPVDPEVVAATLPFLNRHVAAMVLVQQLTGMRPGEVCRLTTGQLDRSEQVWVYRPVRHKNAHRGKTRAVPVGPQAQAVLSPFLAAASNPDVALFSPRQAREERFRAMRAARKSKVPPSQTNRRKVVPLRLPALAYCPESYAHAVGDAVEKVNARRRQMAGEGGFDPLPHWHPNQLRHAHGTLVRRRYGLEAAGASLGHSKMSATEVYAERDLSLAVRVAAELG